VPGALDVGAEGEQALTLGLGERRRRSCRERIPFVLESAEDEQALVPAAFQLGGDKAVIRVNRIILPPRPGCLVARLIERELDLASLFCILGTPGLHGADRRLDAR
jgi:PleD family two-component response regulator